MNLNLIKGLIKNGEGINVEFKSSQEELTQSGFETVVSFLNTIGGYLFLGINDDGKVAGVNEELASTIKINFANAVNNREKINPPMPLMFQEAYIDNFLILYVYVPESSEVHKLNNQLIFERTDEGDRNITDNSYAVKRLYNRKSGYKTEDIILPNITFDDFNRETIAKARKLTTIYSPSNNWKELSDEEILTQRYFYKTDKLTGKQGYTLSALLLFGKKDVICGELSWYKVDVLKKIRDVERFDDRFICEENLIDSYDALLKYIENNIEMPFYLNNQGITYNAVGVIVREIVSNILIHREFMDKTPARILIYKDRIVSENANTPKLFTKVDLDNSEPFSKNSTIARVFRMIGYADEVGSGFEKIKNACNDYFNSKPIIEDKDTFKANISLVSTDIVTSAKVTQKDIVLKFIAENGKITSEQCKNILNLEKSRVNEIINELLNLNKIYRHGKGKATYYDFNN